MSALREQYVICQQRGHLSQGKTTDYGLAGKRADWDICAYCGVHYRLEQQPVLVERFVPEEPTDVADGTD